MSNFVRHRCYKVIHVKILRFEMQDSTCTTKFSSNTQRIQVGNGQYVSVLFVIPVVINVHGHRFKIFTLVSKIHNNVDLVIGMKNIIELEGGIDSRDSCFSFLSRPIPFFMIMTVEIAPKSQKMIIVEAPFYRRIIRNGHGKDFRHERANHKHDKIKIH